MRIRRCPSISPPLPQSPCSRWPQTCWPTDWPPLSGCSSQDLSWILVCCGDLRRPQSYTETTWLCWWEKKIYQHWAWILLSTASRAKSAGVSSLNLLYCLLLARTWRGEIFLQRGSATSLSPHPHISGCRRDACSHPQILVQAKKSAKLLLSEMRRCLRLQMFLSVPLLV